MTVIFAHPRWNYGSYTDYKRLIDLSGYPSCYMDEMDLQSDNTYIFSTPATDWHHGWPEAKCRIIYYCIEWYLDVDYSVIPGVEVWSADKWYADLKNLRYVPMGSHPALNPNPRETVDKIYDVCTLWAGSYTRYHAEDLLQREGLQRAPNGWDEARHTILSKSRSMVVVHQNPQAPTVAPQRWAMAAAYKLPVISETLGNAGIFEDVTVQANLEDIGVIAANRLKPANVGKLIEMGKALHNLLCYEYTFQKGIEAAL